MARRDIEAAIKRAIAAREQQLQDVVRRVSGHFTRLKNVVVGALGGADLITLQRQLGRLLQDLATQTQLTARAATNEIVSAQQDALDIGVQVVDAPLGVSGAVVNAPDVTLPLMQVLSGFTADRITNLSADLLDQISLELRLAALGAKPVYDVIVTIADKLRDAGAGNAGFGSLQARAEAITRTELGRIHSMAGQRRMEQAAEQFPDMMKEWRHSGLRLHPRDGHRAYHGTRVPVLQPFRVAPTRGGRRENLMFPRDPAASARSTVRCRCEAIPWRPSWGE